MQTLETGTEPEANAVRAGEAGEATRGAFAPAMPVASQTALAIQDLMRGARAFHVWGLLGWLDVRRHYRRSTLGPFWLTISMGALVGALGVLYGGLFKLDIADYLPFIAAGFIIWGLVAGLFSDGSNAFIGASNIIMQADLPLSVHVYRVVWRNVIIFAHNAVIYIVVAVLFSVQPGWVAFLALPGLAVLCLNGVWVGLLIGLLSTRYRDVPQIVDSIVRIAFFLTPIIWKPDMMPERAIVLDLNPFFHFIELVRAPLLGQAPGFVSWIAVLGITLGGWIVTLCMYRHYRWRIAYWL